MGDDEQREIRWIGRAGTASGCVGLALAWLGLWAAGDGVLPMNVLGAIFLWGAGSLVGWIGAAARSPGRASVIGTIAVGLPAVFLVSPSQWVLQQAWLVAGFAATGSILAQVGAVASGTAACGHERPHRIQFTMRQILIFFIPVAVYCGCLHALMRK
jgi:hypothetical protein